LIYEPPAVELIVPIEKIQTAAITHAKNTAKFIKKKITGTSMILKVLPTKSAAASKIAMEITRDLHMHIIAQK
jgi:hypothetical protein